MPKKRQVICTECEEDVDEYYCDDCELCDDCAMICKQCNKCMGCDADPNFCNECMLCEDCSMICKQCNECYECNDAEYFCEDCNCCSVCVEFYICCGKHKSCNQLSYIGCQTCGGCDECVDKCHYDGCEKCLKCFKGVGKYCKDHVNTCKYCNKLIEDICYDCIRKAVPTLPMIELPIQCRRIITDLDKLVSKRLRLYDSDTGDYHFYSNKRITADTALEMPEIIHESYQWDMRKHRIYVIRENVTNLQAFLSERCIEILNILLYC